MLVSPSGAFIQRGGNMICADKEITVFHYNKDTVTKEYYGNVSVFSEVKASVSDIENTSSSEIVVRIPSNQEICVDIGDRIILRKIYDEEIPYEETYTVYSIKNNIRGSRGVRHYCLKCR